MMQAQKHAHDDSFVVQSQKVHACLRACVCV